MNNYKVPVEYIVTTTSDWTEFEIIEGGQWLDFHPLFIAGESSLVQKRLDAKTIYLEKKDYDKQPVVLSVKCLLNMAKDSNTLKYRICKGDIQWTSVVIKIKGRKSFFIINDEDDGSDGGTNPKTFNYSVSDYNLDLRKEKVFIVHGRDRLQTLLLSDYLHKRGLNAMMFEDLTHLGKTIIEQIEYVRDNVAYAFVILTPDDVGCLSEEIDRIVSDLTTSRTLRKDDIKDAFAALRHRARQNVIFEFGLFVGALGRENVCILKQRDVDEIPTDINAVLYEEFDKEVSEVFHKLHDELGI